MMIVTKKGLTSEELKDKKEFWWQCKKFTCEDCNCEFTLERHDRPRLNANKAGIVILIEAFVNCPNCNKELQMKELPQNYELLREIDYPLTVGEARENIKKKMKGSDSAL